MPSWRSTPTVRTGYFSASGQTGAGTFTKRPALFSLSACGTTAGFFKTVNLHRRRQGRGRPTILFPTWRRMTRSCPPKAMTWEFYEIPSLRTRISVRDGRSHSLPMALVQRSETSPRPVGPLWPGRNHARPSCEGTNRSLIDCHFLAISKFRYPDWAHVSSFAWPAAAGMIAPGRGNAPPRDRRCGSPDGCQALLALRPPRGRPSKPNPDLTGTRRVRPGNRTSHRLLRTHARPKTAKPRSRLAGEWRRNLAAPAKNSQLGLPARRSLASMSSACAEGYGGAGT